MPPQPQSLPPLDDFLAASLEDEDLPKMGLRMLERDDMVGFIDILLLVQGGIGRGSFLGFPVELDPRREIGTVRRDFGGNVYSLERFNDDRVEGVKKGSVGVVCFATVQKV